MLRTALTVGVIAAVPWYVVSTSLVKRLFPFSPKSTHPLLLSTFKIYKTTKNDTWNKKPNSEFHCRILAEDNDPNARAGIKEIGHFNYRATVGQVGGIYLKPEYLNRLLREQILIYMMKDMLDHGATHIWETSPPELEWGMKRHYTGLWDFQYTGKQPAHPSVTGSGYTMKIPSDPRELVIKPREAI